MNCILSVTAINETADNDECLANPCQNNGTCENTEGGFECKCTEGWEGELCSGKYKRQHIFVKINHRRSWRGEGRTPRLSPHQSTHLLIVSE